MALTKPTKLKELERKNKDKQAIIQEKNNIIEEQALEITRLQEQLGIQGQPTLAEDLKQVRQALFNEEQAHEETKKKLNLKTEECERLKHRLRKNSQNSSKPPSTNGFKKPIYNSRVKTGKKTGGQLGHKGHHLAFDTDVDEVIEQKPTSVCSCGGAIILDEKPKRKQIIDIEIKKVVREERVFTGRCVCCTKKYSGNFSTNSKAHVQYGENLRGMIGLLSLGDFVPIKRLKETITQLTHGAINIGEGTIVNIINEIGKASKDMVDELKQTLRKADVLYVDETPIKYENTKHYAHVATDGETVVLEGCATRGFEEITKMDILPGFVRVVMSDHFSIYNKLSETIPARCNAHILRELQGLYELSKRDIILTFRKYLQELNQWAKAYKINHQAAPPETCETFKQEYLRLLQIWESQCMPLFDAYAKKHPEKKISDNPLNEERCLVKRLQEHVDAHLRFITDFRVAFDNNIAERSLRMAKTKMKVSGPFRSEQAMESFFNARSIIQTKRNKGELILNTFIPMFNPIIPTH